MVLGSSRQGASSLPLTYHSSSVNCHQDTTCLMSTCDVSPGFNIRTCWRHTSTNMMAPSTSRGHASNKWTQLVVQAASLLRDDTETLTVKEKTLLDMENTAHPPLLTSQPVHFTLT